MNNLIDRAQGWFHRNIKKLALESYTTVRVCFLNAFSQSASARIRIGKGTYISPHARLDLGSHSIDIGNNCWITAGAVISSHGAPIKIGNNTLVHFNSVVHGGTNIGNDCLIAAGCIIIAGDHKFQDKNTPIPFQGRIIKGVEIGDDVWLGANVKILPGSIIGSGCVVGAGSVTKGNLDSYGVYAGTLARKIKSRGNE